VKAVDVKLHPSWRKRFALLAMMLVPVAGTLVLMSMRSFAAGATGPGQIYLLLSLAAFASVAYFPVFARRWATRLDEAGVTLRSGRFFPWAHFKGMQRVRRGEVPVRYELKFQEGTAYVLPLMLENGSAVQAAIEELETLKKIRKA